MNKYEITLYNQIVRDLVRDNKSHHHYDSGWADQRFVQIGAHNEDDAKRVIHRRYPEQKGFVIVDVSEIPGFE
jgi:hypothetical protein